jgi:hypothetical protein
MQSRNRRATTGAMLFALGSSVALGDGSVPITILNDNPDTILVTVYDMNSKPRMALLQGREINGFASISVTVTAGRHGHGHLSWTARSADSFVGKCGAKDRPRLTSDTVVHVYAKSDCAAP